MDIMEQVRQLTHDRVVVGPGTLYNLLEQFLEAGMIQQTRAEGRRRSYILTLMGHRTLEREIQRLELLIQDYHIAFGEEDIT